MPFPLKPAQTTSKTASKGRGLSLFTEAEALSCVILRADKIYSIDENGANSTFVFWIIKIRDSYGNPYEWRDFSLSSNPGRPAIANAIKIHLTENVYQLPYNGAIENAENVLHTVTVGDADEGVNDTVKGALDA
mgnify:CR=1 FL=1|tara:strand:+ start:2965 stop:3366 length:402 start_codon:yes stop_codon:yes gene_type:complete